MGLWTKEQLRHFIKEKKLVTAQDAQNALKDLFAETIQEMLEAEIDTHLGYDKHDVKNKQTTNSHNGKSRTTVMSEIWRARNRCSTRPSRRVRTARHQEAPIQRNGH